VSENTANKPLTTFREKAEVVVKGIKEYKQLGAEPTQAYALEVLAMTNPVIELAVLYGENLDGLSIPNEFFDAMSEDLRKAAFMGLLGYLGDEVTALPRPEKGGQRVG